MDDRSIITKVVQLALDQNTKAFVDLMSYLPSNQINETRSERRNESAENTNTIAPKYSARGPKTRAPKKRDGRKHAALHLTFYYHC